MQTASFYGMVGFTPFPHGRLSVCHVGAGNLEGPRQWNNILLTPYHLDKRFWMHRRHSILSPLHHTRWLFYVNIYLSKIRWSDIPCLFQSRLTRNSGINSLANKIPILESRPRYSYANFALGEPSGTSAEELIAFGSMYPALNIIGQMTNYIKLEPNKGREFSVTNGLAKAI